MLKYKNFTDLFIQKFKPKFHCVKATIFWINKNYPSVKVQCTRQVLDEQIARFERYKEEIV